MLQGTVPFLQPSYEDQMRAFAGLEPLGQMPAQNPYTSQAQIPIPPEQEQDNLLTKLAGGGLTALQFIGNVLDTPGSMVRNTLVGENPFKGLFNPDERTSSSDFADKTGLISKDDEGFWPEVGRIGLSAVVDPLTYTGLGGAAKTISGQAAEKAGILGKAIERGPGSVLNVGRREGYITKSLADIAGGLDRTAIEAANPTRPSVWKDLSIAAGGDTELTSLLNSGEKLGSLGTFMGVPFGTGKVAQTIGRGLDKAGEAARYSAPGRYAAALFTHGAGVATSKEGQIAAKEFLQEADRLKSKYLEGVGDVSTKLKNTGIDTDTMYDALDHLVEGNDIATHTGGKFYGRLDANQAAELKAAANELIDHKDELFKSLQSYGFDISKLDDYVNKHFPSYADALENVAGEKKGNFLQRILGGKKMDSSKMREDILRYIPGRRATINDMTRDAALFADIDAGNLAGATQRIERYLGTDQAMRTEFANANMTVSNIADNLRRGSMTPQNAAAAANAELARAVGQGAPQISAALGVDKMVEALDDASRMLKIRAEHPEKLYEWLKDYPQAARGKKLFGDPLNDMAKYVMQGSDSLASVKGIVEFLDKNAVNTGGPGMKSLRSVLEGAGMNVRAVEQKIGRSASNSFVPEALANDVTKWVKTFTSSDAMDGLIGIGDSFLKAFKRGVTTPWPGFHIRNWMQATWDNLIHGGTNPGKSWWNPLASLQPQSEFKALLSGEQEIKGLAQRLSHHGNFATDKEATDWLKAKAWSNRVLPGAVDDTHNLKFVDRFVKGVAGGDPKTITGDVLPNYIPQFLGGKGFHPMVAGQNAGQIVEDSVRGGQFLSLLEQGYSPEQAALKVGKTHVDYTKFSEFEKKFMARAMPFYKWMRAKVPVVIQELMEHPGGMSAQGIRASNSVRENKGFVPDWIGRGMAIPLGDEEDGKKKFITQIDLPFEALNETLSLNKSFMPSKLLGTLNPLAKIAIESMTGRQTFSGREMSDLKTPFSDQLDLPKGAIPSLFYSAIYNSPGARGMAVLGTMMDTDATTAEKLARLTTGIRSQTVDMTKARDIEARKAIESQLKQDGVASVFDKLYVKPEMIPMLTPEQLKLFGLYQGIAQRAHERALKTRQLSA